MIFQMYWRKGKNACQSWTTRWLYKSNGSSSLFIEKSHVLFPVKAYKEWGWNNPPNSTRPPKLILNSIYGPEG